MGHTWILFVWESSLVGRNFPSTMLSPIIQQSSLNRDGSFLLAAAVVFLTLVRIQISGSF